MSTASRAGQLLLGAEDADEGVIDGADVELADGGPGCGFVDDGFARGECRFLSG